jgi:hypothetical protein
MVVSKQHLRTTKVIVDSFSMILRTVDALVIRDVADLLTGKRALPFYISLCHMLQGLAWK